MHSWESCPIDVGMEPVEGEMKKYYRNLCLVVIYSYDSQDDAGI